MREFSRLTRVNEMKELIERLKGEVRRLTPTGFAHAMGRKAIWRDMYCGCCKSPEEHVKNTNKLIDALEKDLDCQWVVDVDTVPAPELAGSGHFGNSGGDS